MNIFGTLWNDAILLTATFVISHHSITKMWLKKCFRQFQISRSMLWKICYATFWTNITRSFCVNVIQIVVFHFVFNVFQPQWIIVKFVLSKFQVTQWMFCPQCDGDTFVIFRLYNMSIQFSVLVLIFCSFTDVRFLCKTYEI